jgi:RHS repeat-associated protein
MQPVIVKAPLFKTGNTRTITDPTTMRPQQRIQHAIVKIALTQVTVWARTGFASQNMLSRPFASLLFLLLTVLTFGATGVHAQPVSQSVLLPNQEYTESRVDLQVKVLGGYVKINRTWVSGRWWLNPAWANLKFIADPLGGIQAIDRTGSIYQRFAANADGSVYQFSPTQFIAQTPTGWRWYDQAGHRIDYNAGGQILSYADPVGVQVSFQYNSQGYLTAIQDHLGRQVITVQSDGSGRVTQVSDTQEPSRHVNYTWSGSGSTSRLESVTDLLGQTWRYQYNSAGQITQRTDPLGATVQITYLTNPAQILDSPGFAGMGPGSSVKAPSTGSTAKLSAPQTARVARLQDEAGTITNYNISYNTIKQQYLIGVQLPGGANRSTLYDRQGRILSDSMNGEQQTQRSIEENNGVVTRITEQNQRGGTTFTDYNYTYQPIRIIYPDGGTESNEYDAQGRKTKNTSVLGVISTWSYDSKGNLLQYVEAKGQPEQRTTRYTYDGYGQPTSQTRGAGNGTASDAVTYTYQYDGSGNLVKTINPMGNSATTTYNSQGSPLTKTDALNRTTKYSYDGAGNLTSQTNALNQTTQYTYDALGRQTQVISPTGRTQTTIYDVAGRVIETLAPGQTQGQGTRTQYDNAGRLVQSTSPSGLITKTSYDTWDRVTSVTDPAGNVTSHEYGAADSPLAGLRIATQYPAYKETYQYDQREQMTAITQQLGAGQSITQYEAYDAAGLLANTIDPNGNSTLYEYDALERRTQTTDPLAQVTRQTWDAQNNRTSVTDAKGNTYTFEYDKAKRIVKETRPMGGAIQYNYDAAGHLTKRTDAAGNTIAYSYDAAGNITTEEHRLSGTTLDERVTYSYDADGQLTGYEQKDGSGNLISSASYTLDAQGRTIQSVITYGKINGSGSFSFTIGQSFDADGQLAGHKYPDGSQSSYAYSQGHLAQVTLPNGSKISYGSYNWQTPTSIQTPGATKTIAIDALQRPTKIEVKNAEQTLASRQYQYDPTGNITQIDSDLGQTQYSYDKLDRLTKAAPDQNLQNLNLPLEQYDYDLAGNRTFSLHQRGLWSYNADNQLTQYPQLTPFNLQATPLDTQVSYTAQGHTASETNSQTQKSYSYNAAERLIQYASTPQGQATPSLEVGYRYDPFGRRIAKSVTEGASTTATYFLYSDSALMAEANEQGQLQKAYGFNPEMVPQDLWSPEPMWQANIANGSLTDTSTSYHYLHTDHLGTPVLATDKSGATTWKAVAEAFGASNTLPESTITVNLRLPGQYLDQETGSHYNDQRDYRPNLGRYLQSDPTGLDGGFNMYAYVMQNPLNRIDPQGLADNGNNREAPNGQNNTDDHIGHSNFYCWNIFDYTRLDREYDPVWGVHKGYTKYHFRSQESAEAGLRFALGRCDKKSYELLMHEGQDYFFHHRPGYRASGGGCKVGIGHWCAGHDPDNTKNPLIFQEWLEANRWTHEWADKWIKKCSCNEGCASEKIIIEKPFEKPSIPRGWEG